MLADRCSLRSQLGKAARAARRGNQPIDETDLTRNWLSYFFVKVILSRVASGASIYRLTSELRVRCPDKHVQIVRNTEWLFCGLKRYLNVLYMFWDAQIGCSSLDGLYSPKIMKIFECFLRSVAQFLQTCCNGPAIIRHNLSSYLLSWLSLSFCHYVFLSVKHLVPNVFAPLYTLVSV